MFTVCMLYTVLCVQFVGDVYSVHVMYTSVYVLYTVCVCGLYSVYAIVTVCVCDVYNVNVVYAICVCFIQCIFDVYKWYVIYTV